MATELRRITIPVGSKVTVERTNGTQETYVFHGTYVSGPAYKDAQGNRHKDVGEYVRIRIDDGPWQ